MEKDDSQPTEGEKPSPNSPGQSCVCLPQGSQDLQSLYSVSHLQLATEGRREGDQREGGREDDEDGVAQGKRGRCLVVVLGIFTRDHRALRFMTCQEMNQIRFTTSNNFVLHRRYYSSGASYFSTTIFSVLLRTRAQILIPRSCILPHRSTFPVVAFCPFLSCHRTTRILRAAFADFLPSNHPAGLEYPPCFI